MLVLSAEAGTRPGGRGTSSLLRQRKVPKRKATPSLRPLRGAKGQPASGRFRGAPQNSLRAFGAPFKQLRRVSQRGMRASTRMLTPQPPRRRRSQQGWDSRTTGQPNCHTGLCFARPRGRGAKRLRVLGRAQRSKAMARMDVFSAAPLYAPRSAAGGVACVPKDTHASWSSSSQLFERSAKGAQ